MLEILRRVIQEVNAARDLTGALNIIVDRVQESMGTQACTVYLTNDDDTRYVFMATRGLNQSAVGSVSLSNDEGLVSYVGERAEPVNLENATTHPRYLFVEAVGEEPYKAFLGVPIIHHRKVLGVLFVQDRHARKYDESEEAFLITLSAQLAGVIAHAEATGALNVETDSASLPASKFRGKVGAPGIAFGTAVVVYPEANLNTVPERKVANIDVELTLFRVAINEVRDEIREMGAKLSDRLKPEELGLFDAYLHMLDDSAIAGEVEELILQGHWAQGALRRVIELHVANFEAMDDSYLRERGTDVRDLGQRVLAKLQFSTGGRDKFPRDTILVGDELTPSMLASVPRDCLKGLVAVRGSGSSHVAILAKAMGVPSVMGAEDLPIELLEEKPLIVDGQGRSGNHPHE